MPYVKKQYTTEFEKTKYLKTSLGEHLIRILDEDTEGLYVLTHWFGGSVRCLGRDCPQCAENARIRAEAPETYRNIPGYRAIQARIATNVLVLSKVKVCPSCSKEVNPLNNNFPSTCVHCNHVIVDVEPIELNEVRVLMKGKNTFEQLDAQQASMLDDDGNVRPCDSYTIKLLVTNPRQAPVILITDDFRPIEEFGELEKFDLQTLVPEVSVEEMEKLARGVPLRDIFAERRLSRDAEKIVSANPEKIVKDLLGEDEPPF